MLANTAPPGCASVMLYYTEGGRNLTFGCKSDPVIPQALREVAQAIEMERFGVKVPGQPSNIC